MKKESCNPVIPIYYLRYMIEERRQEILQVFKENKDLQSPLIIHLSQELDVLLNLYLDSSKNDHQVTNEV
ncbi:MULTISPECIES: aspartyl-phosphate phosphatase Spo0E family protein [Bacillales]|uniref:aspartyl-phosphate phosphatase Spo0E family protein n=1 Tax=Bacillales TaxID=1385 RepID=UPI001E351222|nr:aspartyl-phosphate phosphatase Spo0E family protein [Metabacillus sp. B2-18]UGB30977.1 aspartyl-phosphate phosphatase Spo0E family protein [Metabacillus sp. B2-18]